MGVSTYTEHEGRDARVENDDDIRATLRYSTAARTTLTCGFCGEQHRARAEVDALSWWHTHLCAWGLDKRAWCETLDEALAYASATVTSDEHKPALLGCLRCGATTRVARDEASARAWWEGHECK